MKASLGENYTELLDEFIVRPLKVTNTGPSPGDDDLAVIPPVENSWGSDYGDNTPSVPVFSQSITLA